VVSYGFGVGHVRASNAALKRFGLAQVARTKRELGPAIERALQQHPEPDGSFARRPSTASLILNDERRARTLPVWRVRTARAATTAIVALAVMGWTLTTDASYDLVSHFVQIRPVTAVVTSRPEVGVLVDAPGNEIPALASAIAADGLHVSFALDRASSPLETSVYSHGDQAVPRLPNGGLVRWLQTPAQLRRLIASMGYHHHFLYASSGPSVGQWWLAHGAGGRLVAGAVQLHDAHDELGPLRAGEVVELTPSSTSEVKPLLDKLVAQLRSQHLDAVPVGRLIRDAGSTV
jgi:hypothetical protein